VKFYYFGLKHEYTKNEIEDLNKIGFDVAHLRDVIMSKFKIDYYPTYILLDKNRKVIKYKIGTNKSMLSSFAKKISELSND